MEGILLELKKCLAKDNFRNKYIYVCVYKILKYSFVGLFLIAFQKECACTNFIRVLGYSSRVQIERYAGQSKINITAVILFSKSNKTFLTQGSACAFWRSRMS